MSFQFVNITPDRPEPDVATRKTIRSQAMKDFRRRKRIEEGESSPSSRASPVGSRSPQALVSVRSRQSSQHRGSKSASPGDSPSETNPLLAPESSRRSRRRSTAQPSPQHGTFGSFSVSLPSTDRPAPRNVQDVDPLSDPGQLRQMLNVCDRYNQWLLSGLSDQVAPVTASGPWDSETSQMLLFALCLMSIGHLEALSPGQSTYDRRLFKAKVLALANGRLENSAKALEDQTLGALACLTSYEISRGSTEAMIHLSGMSQIIRLRGGTEHIDQSGGLSMFLEILDFVHAVYFASTPMYTSRPRSHGASTLTPETGAAEEPMNDDSALEEITNFLLDLQDLTETETEDFVTQAPTPEPVITPSSFDQEVRHWHQYFTQAAETVAADEDGALAEVCGLAAVLHLYMASAIAPSPTRLQFLRDQLFQTMLGIPEGAWATLEALQVRILLTALATSITVSQKSWYNAHLMRALYRTELEYWAEVKSLVHHFIDMQLIARTKPRTLAVRALVHGIEIVVHPAEAQERDLQIQSAVVEPWTDQ